MKLEANWRSKTLENLEREYWGDPPFDSYLVKRTHEIRKIPISELTNDDLAMMLRQNFSLAYIVPLTIDRLKENILAHGESSHPGDLMETLLTHSQKFLVSNTTYWIEIDKLLNSNKDIRNFDRTAFDKFKPK